MTTQQERLITTSEAATMIGVKPNTLDIWRSTKRVNLPYVKIGRAVRYRPSDIHTYLAKHTISGAA